MKASSILFSWDTCIATVLTLLLGFTLPGELDASFQQNSFTVGITVLSIVFSLFFAAMAIIMSSSDNDFISYMEEEGMFTELMNQFKFTLLSLFSSLVISIFLSFLTDYDLKQSQYIVPRNPRINFLVFIFCFTYSLVATFLNVIDTIKFSIRRASYIDRVRRQQKENEDKKAENSAKTDPNQNVITGRNDHPEGDAIHEKSS